MATKNITKSLSLELKGDTHVQKGKQQKAHECYQQALDLNPERVELYDKLLASHNASKDKWTEEDFVFNLELTMKKQELLDPTFKRVHARHEPEFREIAQLIKKMILEKDATRETRIVEEIISYGVNALYPLIDALLAIKQLPKK